MQLAAEAIAAGDITAITPYLKVLDRLDRYQTVAGAHQVYDDEARKKLMDKINRMAANFGIDEAFEAAVQEHLKKQGAIVDDEPGEAEAVEDPAEPGRGAAGRAKRGGRLGCPSEGSARNLGGEFRRSRDFFIFFARNPLKSPDSAKEMTSKCKGFSFIDLLLLCTELTPWLNPALRRGGAQDWGRRGIGDGRIAAKAKSPYALLTTSARKGPRS